MQRRLVTAAIDDDSSHLFSDVVPCDIIIELAAAGRRDYAVEFHDHLSRHVPILATTVLADVVAARLVYCCALCELQGIAPLLALL